METLALPKTRKDGSKTTNGHYPSDVRRQVADWIRFTLQTKHDPPLSKPLTIHLDVLLGTEIDSQNAAALSFETYHILIEQLAVMGISDTIMPSLYIPLGCAESLIAGPFDAEALIQQINYLQPPSLYLTERTLKTILWPFEQYVFPLQTSDFLENADGVYVYYNATRTLEDIQKGWEYNRTIVAEYYPSAYQYAP